MKQKDQHSDTGSSGLLAWIGREHCAELSLCNLLEQIADDLPEPLDRELANTGVIALRHCLKRHVALEEGHLYPVLVMRARRDEFTEDMLSQIKVEHAADECLAHDTADQLEHALARGGSVERPEMLGYMLRGFFECRRRHIAWEDATILPLASQRLTEKDFRDFSAAAFEEDVGGGIFIEISPQAGCNCGCRNGE